MSTAADDSRFLPLYPHSPSIVAALVPEAEWQAMATLVLPRHVVAGAFHQAAVRDKKRWEGVHGYWSVPCPYCGATPPCR